MTKNEEKLLEIIRELKPFEEVRIVKDQLGRPDHYFITRQQKVVLKQLSTTWLLLVDLFVVVY